MTPAAPGARHACLAVAAPGLAPLLADELRALGLALTAVDEAGVAFDADAAGLARANLWSRLASRVLVRVATFEARGFPELERHARRVPWDAVLGPGIRVRLRVTSRKSRLYHTGAVAERLAGVLAARGVAVEAAPGAEGDDDGLPDDGLPDDGPPADAQLVIVRLRHDRVTISADSSGDLLHRRGWRLATAKAPIRETLAAALLRAAGYDGGGPLVDPMAGSGTIGIEAAALARGLAPGLARRFAFERWPGHDARAWAAMREAARDAARPRAPHPIVVNDRDVGAVEAIRANAARAGVLEDLDVRQGAASALALPEGPGWLVTNPPYGVRVSAGRDLRDLFAALGRGWRRTAPGWRVGIVCATPAMARAFGLPLTPALTTRNGGLSVAFCTGTVPREETT